MKHVRILFFITVKIVSSFNQNLLSLEFCCCVLLTTAHFKYKMRGEELVSNAVLTHEWRKLFVIYQFCWH